MVKMSMLKKSEDAQTSSMLRKKGNAHKKICSKNILKKGKCPQKEQNQKKEPAQKRSMLKRNKGNQLLRELTLTCSLSSPSSKFRSHSVKHFVGLHSPLLNLGCSLQLKMPLMSSMSASPSPLLSILRKAS